VSKRGSFPDHPSLFKREEEVFFKEHGSPSLTAEFKHQQLWIVYPFRTAAAVFGFMYSFLISYVWRISLLHRPYVSPRVLVAEILMASETSFYDFQTAVEHFFFVTSSLLVLNAGWRNRELHPSGICGPPPGVSCCASGGCVMFWSVTFWRQRDKQSVAEE